MDNKKPSALGHPARRRSGGAIQLRSPIVKRPAMAPVALQGWLHKQGSEGLMLWKKRWFVLSEYCLFYYKGPEEEKLLGSILLPSYKVSPCSADDKIYRKFAFKAEHANMRTYYFAAETRELMTQWMNALSLATILQENTKLEKSSNLSSANSLLNQSAEESDSGFQRYHTRCGPITVQPTNRDLNTNELNGWDAQILRKPYQPLYANAPPKPKRLNNEGQYGGSSPETSRNENTVIYGNRSQIQQDGHRPSDAHYQSHHPTDNGYRPGSLPHPDIIRSMPNAGTYPGGGIHSDRRTQGFDGTSNLNTPTSLQRLGIARSDRFDDYSDVYKSEVYKSDGTYRKPEVPVQADYVKTINPPLMNYQHSNQYYQGYHQLLPMSPSVGYQAFDLGGMREKQPPRPHSADFLELDAKKSNQYNRMGNVDKLDPIGNRHSSTRPQRPKSSLEIMHANDGYYWSEESYAEKMRQSAIYLQNTLPQRSQSSRSNTPNFKQTSDGNRVPVGPGSGKFEQSSVVMRHHRDRSNGLKSSGKRWSEYETSGNQFVRSASARLAKNRVADDESDEVQTYSGGEDFKDDGRKEESMKRLLEWKQRMLQSPLTRKPSGSSTRDTAQNELSKFYKQQALKELERQEAKSREESGKKRFRSEGTRLRSRSTEGRRSAMSPSRYNSYSSDDEENGKTRRERNRRASLTGKSRKGSNEPKTAQETTKDTFYLSPDYENVLQQCFLPEKCSGENSYKSRDESRHQGQDKNYSEREETDTKNGIQPCANYPKNGAETKKWGEKIDETKLIKEFSYQYVNDHSVNAVDVDNYKVLEAPPENIVKSRIRQLGLAGKEGDVKEINMKEPLKPSPPMYLPNEAHVSTLKNLGERRNSKSLRQFALGDLLSSDAAEKELPNQKSVKDLLADFEKKSQLVHEKESEESFGKRYVFSDTETLLYDTSSDTEEKIPKPEAALLSNLRRPESRMDGKNEIAEEEDGDEEVAAALGKRDPSFDSPRDPARQRDPTSTKMKKLSKEAVAAAAADVDPSPSSEVETIMTPGFLRSNLTESMMLRENSDSTCSTPIIEKIKDDLERTLPKENLVKSQDAASNQDVEGHYMPMTPSRRVSAPPSDKSRSNSSLHSILYGVEAEETYVEMSENNTKNMDAKSFSTKRTFTDVNSYCEIPESKAESHYDFLYKSTTLREPEYMEVNTLLEILKEQDEKIKEHKGAMASAMHDKKNAPPTPIRSTLPDILNSSATNQQKSDSSDADDESSKDLDSLDTPRHPRFSLSDTFRPASYYLGNDKNLIGLPNPHENHDSSDSDLVSPPPIPTSPPPLDDLDTSLEDRFSESRLKLKMSDKDTSKRHWSKPILNDLDQLEEYRKIKRRPLSEDMAETLNESNLSYLDKKLPVSDLDSIGSRNGVVLDEENGSINIDQYLDGMQFNISVNPQLYSKNLTDSIYKSYEKEMHKNLMPKENTSKTESSEKGLLKLKYLAETGKGTSEGASFGENAAEEVHYENLQNLFPPPPPPELYESGNDSSLGMYRTAPMPDVPPPENYCDVYESLQQNPKVRFDPDTLQQQTDASAKGSENQGAPYYYSDLIKKEDEEFGSSTSDRSLSSLRSHMSLGRYQPLNNQRDDLQENSTNSKRNNIGRKVNPISLTQTSEIAIEREELDDVQKIAEELRTTSAHFMGAADKSETFDLRNIYESDTLQRRKTCPSTENSRDRTPDLHHPQGIARNLYPHALKDKSSGSVNLLSVDPSFNVHRPVNRARSRSLEGLLNQPETLARTEDSGPFARISPGRAPIPSGSRLTKNSCEGSDPWEKDALWRENLRKVSLRHSRSLDNLDDEAGDVARSSERVCARSEITGRRSVDHFTPANRGKSTSTGRRSVDHFKPKLSREVTYVNDGFRRNRSLDSSREYEQDYRELRLRPKMRESDDRTVIELKDSGLLDCDDGVHYERLIRKSPVGLKTSEMYLDRYDWDAEKERFSTPRDKVPMSNSSEVGNADLRSSKREGTVMEPIDREKLRQWDLMSIGIVEQQECLKTGAEPHPKSPEEKSQTRDSNGFPTGKAVEGKAEAPQNKSVQASASGSVMKEVHLPHSKSDLPDRQRQSPRLGNKIGGKMLPRDETSLNMKALLHGRRPDVGTDRFDYYDRGKIGYLNGYSEWIGSYGDRKEDGTRVSDYMEEMLERRRAADVEVSSDYVWDRSVGMYNRNCGTLPLTKSENIAPAPLYNYQGSSMGRSLMDLDGRGPGKDSIGKRKVPSANWGLDVSAGELLGRTHEELVLLLIQLRRQSAGVCKAMETCHIEIEAQARLADVETPKRMEHLQKLEELKKHLLDLEKQYEKGKPLVNLVDNMVKLGSLYRGNSQSSNGSIGLDHGVNVREKLEFNQKVQEQRLLAEERKDWDRLSPDHGQLQAKVQQLYRLDRLLQEESGTLHSLQQDKELLEKALGGLRHKLQVNRSNPAEADKYRKHQRLLEKELSRVRLLLAHNSKKLEETVAENARLEQELVILRQKLQASRVGSRSSMPLLSESSTISTTAALEAELRRVQLLVGDLQRQRHELSAQVKQLTEKSDTLVQQIRPGPTGVAGAGPIPGKKKSNATWLETDLDLLVTRDVGVESPVTSPQHHQLSQQPASSSAYNQRSTTPIYINTEPAKRDQSSGREEPTSPNKISAPEVERAMTYCTPVELSEADERMKRFYGIIPREKQEIKTVRIVKRESERRQRDRDRSGNIGIPIGNTAVAKRVSVIEEGDGFGLGKVEEESYEHCQNSPNFSEQSDELCTMKLNGDYKVNEGKDDPYMNFHPTNPFLPQNLANLVEIESPNQSRSMSLPRCFGKTLSNGRSDNSVFCENGSVNNVGSKKNRVRFDSQFQEGSGSESGPNSPRNDCPGRYYPQPIPPQYGSNRVQPRAFSGNNQAVFGSSKGYHSSIGAKEPDYQQVQIRKQLSPDTSRTLTAREQLFGSNCYPVRDEENSPQLSPVYQSEAAREIIMEMSSNGGTRISSNRRQIPREKRRHHTVSNIRHVHDPDNYFSRMGSARSRDDLDMERALRPRMNAPDVVRSTMSHKDLKYNESTIDSILGTPNKIVIPERYVPEQEPILSAEEQLQRLRKAESIRKMLSETTALSTPDLSTEGAEEDKKSSTLKKKVEEEKKQREHLLELNQILAQQVMEKSKMVAVKALAALPLQQKEGCLDEEDLSPVQPLPLFQQRENYFS